MVAQGEWNGRATVSAKLIRALSINSPAIDPVEIIYQDGKLNFASIKISCGWVLTTKQSIRKLTNPSLLDLLAIEQTAERHELGKTSPGKKCSAALRQKEKSVQGALKYLAFFDVGEEEIRSLIDKNVTAIINRSVID